MSAGVTTNYGLQKPNFNQIPWDGIINANFDLIDSLIYTIAQVPNIAGVWKNSTAYTVGQNVLDPQTLVYYQCVIANTSATTGTFAADRLANPGNWTLTNPGQGSLRYDQGQALSDAQTAVALANIGLYASPLFVTSATTLTPGQFGRAIRIGAAATITMPAAGAGWCTGPIYNAVDTVLGTIAVPAGATIDGALNGTVVVFPRQRLRVLQLDSTTYVTEWLDRSPILRVVPLTSVSSVDLVLPVGYSMFRVLGAGIRASASGAAILARLSDDAGATFKSGSTDYAQEVLSATGNSTVSNGVATVPQWSLSGGQNTATAGNATQFESLLYPGGNNVFPTHECRCNFVETATALRALRYFGGSLSSISANRANALRIFADSGTLTGTIILVGAS